MKSASFNILFISKNSNVSIQIWFLLLTIINDGLLVLPPELPMILLL